MAGLGFNVTSSNPLTSPSSAGVNGSPINIAGINFGTSDQSATASGSGPRSDVGPQAGIVGGGGYGGGGTAVVPQGGLFGAAPIEAVLPGTAGYSAGIDWTPYLVIGGGVALIALVLLLRKRK